MLLNRGIKIQIVTQNNSIDKIIVELVQIRDHVQMVIGNDEQFNNKFDIIIHNLIKLKQSQQELQECINTNISEITTSFVANTPINNPQTNIIQGNIIPNKNYPKYQWNS